MEDFIAIDVEIAARRPIRICAIGAARFESRRETASYHSLVRVEGRVHFCEFHGLSRPDLLRAPRWTTVWRELLDFMGEIRPLVAFPATFDRGALLAMCAEHGFRPPPLPFVCAAAIAEERLGRRLDLVSTLDALGLVFPGQHHDPLSDARAAAAVVMACTPPHAPAAGKA